MGLTWAEWGLGQAVGASGGGAPEGLRWGEGGGGGILGDQRWRRRLPCLVAPGTGRKGRCKGGSWAFQGSLQTRGPPGPCRNHTARETTARAMEGRCQEKAVLAGGSGPVSLLRSDPHKQAALAFPLRWGLER